MQDSPLNDIRLGEVTASWARHNQLPVRYEKTTSSTNDLAKEEAFEAAASEDVKVYLTDHQSQGRGRGKNGWSEGRAGAALLSSWSYVLGDPPQPTLPPRVGLALFKALQNVWPFLPWSLKSPNDIYLNDRKVAGLLLETLSQGPDIRVVVGLGLNVMDAPADLETATSILAQLPAGTPLLGDDWAAFLDRWMFELTDAVARAAEPLTTTEQEALRWALNLRPSLKQKITRVRADASLEDGGGVTPWSEI
ncbi:MAG: biotin synthetase [Bdellovibrionaceae bacterium]|nr:biotin synthetase [Pseudobdellovibrionaceae bacterium]MBX3032328.1 biotin synthetase [Pseudobdellovibrionaceae bacterium]